MEKQKPLLDECNKEKKSLKEELDECNKEKKSLKEELDEEKKSLVTIIERLKDTISSKDETVIKIKKELDNCKVENESLKKENIRMETQLKNITDVKSKRYITENDLIRIDVTLSNLIGTISKTDVEKLKQELDKLEKIRNYEQAFLQMSATIKQLKYFSAQRY